MEELKGLESYKRKAFDVVAIRVTDENMVDVARWAKAEMRAPSERYHDERNFILLPIDKINGRPQTVPVYAGYWITYNGKRYYRHRDKDFKATFTKKVAEGERYDAIAKIVHDVMHKQDTMTFRQDYEDYAIHRDHAIRKILEVFS